jgi:(R,R)-butanediol dehydrogenase/meso-butanediol dehydrogenase/diacetyl reductase
MQTMRAARYWGTEDLRIEELPLPLPGPGEVQVAVAYNGICGTDLHEYFDGARAIPLEPHPLTGAQIPVVLGHEAAGRVSALGSGVEDLREGELVVIEPTRSCHHCEWCGSGDYNLCDRLAFHGLATDGGGLAEFTVVPREMIHRVPAGIDERQAALVEPLSVSRHAIGRWGPRPGATAAIFGGGPIGIGILLGLKAAGVEDLVVIEPAADRRQVTAELGARVIDPSSTDPAEQLRELTAGRGADVCFETAGAPTSFGSAVASTSKHGEVVLLTSGRHEVIAPLGALMTGEITLKTSYAYRDDFGAVLELMAAGAYPIDSWVSTRPLSRLTEAFGELARGEAIKLLIDPREA